MTGTQVSSYRPSKYVTTFCEVGCGDGASTYYLTVCRRSRIAMVQAVRSLPKDAIDRLFVIVGDDFAGDWNGKTRRYEQDGKWWGFTGRTEKEYDDSPIPNA